MSLSEEDAQAVLDQMKAEDEAESRKDEEHKSSIVAIDLDASVGVQASGRDNGSADEQIVDRNTQSTRRRAHFVQAKVDRVELSMPRAIAPQRRAIGGVAGAAELVRSRTNQGARSVERAPDPGRIGTPHGDLGRRGSSRTHRTPGQVRDVGKRPVEAPLRIGLDRK